MKYLNENLSQLAALIGSGALKPSDLVEEVYSYIENYEPKINSFITLIDKKDALKRAEYLEKNKGNFKSSLYGIPFIMKDAYITKDVLTTAASKILGNYIPKYNSTVYEKLEDNGALLIGKSNMDAWGHGASNENSDYGSVRNPWDLERISGGSGGGPAAAIASRFAVFGIGEDTGGSIRNPAAWCGVVGLKVTYGRVSRYGAIAYASSLDTVGPTAKSVEDCAYVLEVIAGRDNKDSSSSPLSVPKYSELILSELKGKKIALPVEYFNDALDPEISRAIYKAKEVFEEMGVVVEEVSIPMLEYGVPLYYILAPSETSSNLARYDGIRYGEGREYFTKESQRRIMIGTYALSTSYYDAYFKKALKVRTLYINEYNKILNKYDAILAPVTPINAPKSGELLNDPMKNMMADIYTVTVNLIGAPALSLPCGFTKNNLPIGMQLIGKMFSEEQLLNIGHKYQSVTEWHRKIPALIYEK